MESTMDKKFREMFCIYRNLDRLESWTKSHKVKFSRKECKLQYLGFKKLVTCRQDGGVLG